MKNHATEPIASRSARFPAAVGVVIPVWKPGSELVGLVRSLAESGCGVIVVIDDGSHESYREIFEQLRGIPPVHLLRHAHNKGKGCALKSGIGYFLSAFPEGAGVVTADADGQHAVEDIVRVAAVLAEHPQRLVLGARLAAPAMPFRSRLGNGLTRHVFRYATGVKLADTQTGLRGFPRSLLAEAIAVGGDRYEYEMAVLLRLCWAGHIPVEVPIRTIYTDGNRSSHFRPLQDSAHVYGVLARHLLAPGSGWKHAGQEQLSREEKIS